MSALTIAEMYAELVRSGAIRPADQQSDLTMPTLYKSVPTFQTYHTVDTPVHTGTKHNARLEPGPSRNRNTAG